MTNEQVYQEAVGAAIAAAWPDVAVKTIFLDTQIEKADWSNLLDTQQMTGPWAVCKIDYTPTTDWGVYPRQSAATSVFYITSDSALPDGVDNMSFFLLGKLDDLRTKFWDGTVPGTVLGEVTLNANTDNPIEQSMLAADQRYSAALITVTAII